MPNTIDNTLLENLSKEEKEYVLKILDEYSKNGSSNTYSDLLYSDYNEIPVDIETFITDDRYLGQALKKADGTSTLYPYWFKVLKDIFPDPFTTNYNTALFTGGIGLGKSTVADIGVAYQLYKLLCLKDPYAYYGLQKIDVITIAFLNNTIDNAKDVAWKKFHEMLLRSPFFLHHGSVNNAKKLPEWEPPNGIDLVAGSSANHILGRCVYACLDGKTIIHTSSGDKLIESLENKRIFVDNVDSDGNIVSDVECTVVNSKIDIEEYSIELEDGTIIKCTPEHRFMLKDGTYKEARYLTDEDELYEITNIDCNGEQRSN